MTTITIKVVHKDDEFDIREEYEVSLEMFDALRTEHQKEFLNEKVWSLRNRVTNELIRMQKQKAHS